jgi:hypothetical protein
MSEVVFVMKTWNWSLKIHHSIIKKTFCFSLYLFSFFTGARAITCVNIQLKHIKVLSKKDNRYVISIIQDFTIGTSNWQHPVTFEGQIEDFDSMCFVYWLNQHLKKSFDLNLNFNESWNLCEKKGLLFMGW